MADNIFDQLMDLLNQPGPVNWKLAHQIASHMSGDAEPIDPWLAEEYLELTRVAQLHIAEASGLAMGGVVDAIPVDKRQWTERNLRSFRYLVEPLADKLTSGAADLAPMGGMPGMGAMLGQLGPALLGLQMGAMVGYMSHRVLGQFDIGLPTADPGDLYYVVPNIEAFASGNGLDPRQVRLWVALHEVTHQAEFAQDWVRPHFMQLITAYIEDMQVDTGELTEQFQDFSDPAKLQELLSDPAGLTGMLTGSGNKEKLDAIHAFMSVMEGYSDYLMDRAAPKLLPDLDRMRAAMSSRREDQTEGESLLNRLLGMDLKREQYEQGAAFCTTVEERWGAEALAKLWEGPEHLPSMDEIRDPLGWAARVLLDDLTDGL